jgi:hypothetical protein
MLSNFASHSEELARLPSKPFGEPNVNDANQQDRYRYADEE